eukprot:g3892.t1
MLTRVLLFLFVSYCFWNFTIHVVLELRTGETTVPRETVATANLTVQEFELLSELNWSNFGPDILNELDERTNSGIPTGVRCQTIDWCDSLACTEVCKRGTVVLEPWLKSAIKSQARVALTRELPICYAQWLGSHNSGITLSDGYGNRDPYYTKLLKLTKWDKDYVFETHNQLFSLTDQLNMGVRVLELDVHWVKGNLRIAHCGGVTSAPLDYISLLINLVSKLIGRPFRWDTETIGCDPSASSIKAGDQRLLSDAMEEIADWLKLEENSNEFIMVLLDDQRDLSFWGLLPQLKKQLVKYIPNHWVFTPSDTHLIVNGALPSANFLLNHGKRLMFISSMHYDDSKMRSFLFYRKDKWLCGWSEPHMDALDLIQCTLPSIDYTKWVPTMSGTISRLSYCEIRYGPFSCDLKLEDTEPALDNDLLRKVFACGYSFPSPDRISPNRAKAAIWSWAPEAQWDDNMVVVMSSVDGHWRFKDPHFTSVLPIACVNINSTLHYEWKLHYPSNDNFQCPNGFIPAIPRHGKENSNLQEAMKKDGIIETRLIGAELYYYREQVNNSISI